MTDDEAREALDHKYGSDGYVEWHSLTDTPFWFHGKIELDGEFTAHELLAILHFAPKE